MINRQVPVLLRLEATTSYEWIVGKGSKIDRDTQDGTDRRDQDTQEIDDSPESVVVIDRNAVTGDLMGS